MRISFQVSSHTSQMSTKPGRDQPPKLLRALAEHPLSPSCSTLWQRLAEGFWGLGLSPCARQHTEDGCSARCQWQGAGAGRGVVEQGQTGQTGSYAPIYCHLSFCIHIPIKVEPGHDSPHLGGSVHPAQLSPSLPPSSSCSKAACRSCNTP